MKEDRSDPLDRYMQVGGGATISAGSRGFVRCTYWNVDITDAWKLKSPRIDIKHRAR